MLPSSSCLGRYETPRIQPSILAFLRSYFYVAPALGLYSFKTVQNLGNLPVPEADDFSVGFVMFAVSCGILAILKLCFRQGHKSGRQSILGEPQNS